ncbi:unnamed protein product [Sympodiomycopsis kandeliae]
MLRSRSPSKAPSSSAGPSRPVSRGSPSRNHSRPGSTAIYFEDEQPAAYNSSRARPRAPEISRTDSRSTESVTRVEFWDAIVEPGGNSEAILPWLGSLITDHNDLALHTPDLDSGSGMPSSSSSGSINAIQNTGQRPSQANLSSGSAGNPVKFESQLRELLETERSYVRRLDALYNRYAQPLRQAARDRLHAVIPLYEAQRLFGNVGELLGANMAFLQDLEALTHADPQMNRLKATIGELAHRHVACFGCYNEYFNNFEKAKHIEQTMSKTNKPFRDFVEHVKQTSPNLGNVSIRELIMEPVQRIPRYKLLLDGLIKSLPAEYRDQRPKLEEAVALCGRIASCEVDEKTQRAAVLWSFGRNVHGFPAGLFSVHRRFIDSIDVDDFPLDYAGGAVFSPGSSQAARPIPCTLFLFDDSILVAKRSNPLSSGRQLLAIDDLDRLADEMKTFTERSGTSANQNKKPELGFRGVVDIADVIATDLGGPDLQLQFRRPPSHIHHEKWSGRPTRQYSTMPDPTNGYPARIDKIRFLENLWRSQALQRTRDQKSELRATVAAASSNSVEDSPMMDAEPRRIIYWNIFTAATYALEPVKNGALLHVDTGRSGAILGLGHEHQAPHAQLRILSIDEEYSECSYSVLAKGRRPDEDVYVLSLSDLATKMRKLHDSAVIQDDAVSAMMNFRPGAGPSTPSSHRVRVVAGLENFGRSLFNGTPGSIRSVDVFGSPRRKGSILSKSSMASTLASDFFSSSGRSVSTAGTSVNSRDMLSMQPSAAIDNQGKLLPPGGSPTSPRHSRTRAQSAGPVEMMYVHKEEETSMHQDKTPRRPASQILLSADDSHTPNARARTHSAMSPNEVEAQLAPVGASTFRQSIGGRPTGPRALAGGSTGTPTRRDTAADSEISVVAAPTSPRRKPVPFPSESAAVDRFQHPYTPTRRVVSGSKRRAPEQDPDEATDDGSYSPSRRHSNKRTAPPTPPKDTKPLSIRNQNVQPQPPASSNKTNVPLQSRKGRIRRQIARLDSSDKENSDALGELAEELNELQGIATEYTSSVLGDLTSRLEAWLSDASDRCVDNKSMIDRVAGEVEVLLRNLEEAEQDAKDAHQVAESLKASTVSAPPPLCPLLHIEESQLDDLRKKAAEHAVSKTRVDALQRRCELLTALESDGRLENGELHKAFNEELDRLYEHTQSDSSADEINALREEVKRTKSERNEMNSKLKEMERKYKLATSDLASYEKRLRDEGLL